MTNEPKIAPLEPDKIAGEHGDYFAGILPLTPTVCGRVLKPLSIGHYRMMALMNVAFAADEEREALPGDLLMGVLICSMSVDDFMALVAQPDFVDQVKKWGRKIGFFPPKMFGWRIMGRWLEKLCGEVFAEADFKFIAEQSAVFQKYIKDGSTAPEYWDESPDSKASAAHWSQSIEVVLRGNLNWSEQEVKESPLSKALWDYFKYMENQGLVRLMSKAEARELATPLTPEQAAAANESAQRALAAMRGEAVPETEVARG